MVRYWIQKAISRPGKLHKELKISKEEKIPLALLNAIVKAKAGQTVKNPTKKGKRKIFVTRGIERRAILARKLKQLHRKA